MTRASAELPIRLSTIGLISDCSSGYEVETRAYLSFRACSRSPFTALRRCSSCDMSALIPRTFQAASYTRLRVSPANWYGKERTNRFGPNIVENRRRLGLIRLRILRMPLRIMINLLRQERCHGSEDRDVSVKHLLEDVDDVAARESRVRVGVKRVLRYVKVEGGQRPIRERRQSLVGYRLDAVSARQARFR